MSLDKTPWYIKIDERNYVEKPLLDQLAGLGWDVIDLDGQQRPADTYRHSFTQPVLLPVLSRQRCV